jgi:hypothetical protein
MCARCIGGGGMSFLRKKKADNYYSVGEDVQGHHTINAMLARIPVLTDEELSQSRKVGNRATVSLAITHPARKIELDARKAQAS